MAHMNEYAWENIGVVRVRLNLNSTAVELPLKLKERRSVMPERPQRMGSDEALTAGGEA